MVAMGDSVTFGVGDGAQWPDGMSGWAAHVATALGATCTLPEGRVGDGTGALRPAPRSVPVMHHTGPFPLPLSNQNP